MFALGLTIGIGVSLPTIGVLWPVIRSFGFCGCGKVEMTSVVGYFPSREGAEIFIKLMKSVEGEPKR